MNMRVLMAFILVFTLCGNAYAAEEISLHCSGSGIAKDTQTSTVDTEHLGARDHEISTVQSITKRNYTGTADVKIGPGFARLRPPEAMLPTFNSVEDDGWLDIQELSMNESQITGEVSFNLFNKPDIKINRLTGEIVISGMGTDFQGECEAIDHNAKPKF